MDVETSARTLLLIDRIANALKDRYDRTGSTSDLGWTIEFNDVALACRSPGHVNRSASLNILAEALRTRFNRTGDPTDLERAIELHAEALDLRRPGHGDRAMSLNNLALALHTRFSRMGDSTDLERVIELLTEALYLHPPGHGERGSSLNNLAEALRTRFGRKGDPTDLERVIEMHTEALGLRPPGHEERGIFLNNLALALYTRFGGMGDPTDLGRAIELLTEALGLHPPGHGVRGMSLNNLASALHMRFGRMGNPTDLERIIELLTEALGLHPPCHGDRGTFLNNLAEALRLRFGRMGDPTDLERVIELNTEASGLRPPGHAGHGMSLNNLAEALRLRYDRMGHPRDLERVIELNTEALSVRPPGHGDRSMSLNNLASALRTRFGGMGDPTDLERLIELHKEALGLRPPGHGERGTFLNNLAFALHTRFNRMGDPIDLECVIELDTEALVLHPPGHGGRGVSLNSLAIALHTRFGRMGNLTDLERVIELFTEALHLHPPGHEGHDTSLNNLAEALRARFNRIGDPMDLEHAIELHTEALSLCPPGHGGRGTSLNNLASALRTRFNRTGHLTDLERVINLNTEALDLRPLGNISRAASITGLASALWALRDPPREKIFRLLKEGSKDLSSNLGSSFSCVRLWFQYGREVGDHTNVNDAYDSFVDLLRYHLPIWPTVKLQYDALCRRVEMLEFPMDVAAHAINTGDLNRAMECLDAGRSLLLSELGRFRLKERLLESRLLDKQLIADFEAVCSNLQSISTVEARYDNPLSPFEPERSVGVSYDALLRRKRELIERYNTLLRRISITEGGGGFLDRPSFEELRWAAKEGPVIIVNCSEYGSHVIFVFVDKPPSITRLDEFFRRIAQRLHVRLKDATGVQSTPKLLGRVLKEVTRFLWEFVVEDVVAKLRREGLPEGSRIWWCPTSFLNAFPFHAAGDEKHSLVDFYVSSYTPTLKALIDARKSSSLSATTDSEPSPRILVVAQTQDSSNLPAARKEVEVMRNLGPLVDCLDEEEATNEVVLNRLRSHSWVHFICHGTLSFSPFDSSLVLYDGKLSFHDLIKAQLPDAKFAFLAACHTANQTVSFLPDESLHLAGGMFFSGFRSVVGTIWRMRDEDGPDIARKFYEEMLREDDTVLQKPRHTRAAHALWKVTKELKEKKVLNSKGKEVPIGMDRWVNFIHIGA